MQGNYYQNQRQRHQIEFGYFKSSCLEFWALPLIYRIYTDDNIPEL